MQRECVYSVQLLHKMSVRAADGNQKLLRVVKNPVTDHLPVGCQRYATSHTAEKVSEIRSLARDGPVVFVIGAIAHGTVKICPFTFTKIDNLSSFLGGR